MFKTRLRVPLRQHIGAYTLHGHTLLIFSTVRSLLARESINKEYIQHDAQHLFHVDGELRLLVSSGSAGFRALPSAEAVSSSTSGCGSPLPPSPSGESAPARARAQLNVSIK